MARPQKAGLEYFPLDVDIDSDERVEYVIAKHGFQAFGILIKLLMEIYRQGYYITWTERQRYVFSKRINVDSMYAETVVSVYINEGIFEKKLFDEYGILTSHGVQARYLQASGRRVEVEFIEEFFLLDRKKLPKTPKISFSKVSVCNNPSFCIHNVDGNPDKSNIPLAETPQSKVKESNEEEEETPYIPPAESKLTEQEEETARIVSLFENNIHPLSGMIEQESLLGLLDEYGAVWLDEAIRWTVERHGNSVKYIQAILEQWKRVGFKNEERSKTNDRGLQSTRRKNQRKQGEGEHSESFKQLLENIEYAENRPKPWEVQPTAGE